MCAPTPVRRRKLNLKDTKTELQNMQTNTQGAAGQQEQSEGRDALARGRRAVAGAAGGTPVGGIPNPPPEWRRGRGKPTALVGSLVEHSFRWRCRRSILQ